MFVQARARGAHGRADVRARAALLHPGRVGRIVGVGAGLLVALNGGLILSEHTVMTEALFVRWSSGR